VIELYRTQTADIANRNNSYLKALGDQEIAERFEGYEWNSEEDASMTAFDARTVLIIKGLLSLTW
jgi:hypothetical protein